MAAAKRQTRRDLAGVTHETTDLRNAERLIERHGRDLRYVSTWGKWLAWDQRRWALDDTGSVARAGAETVRSMVADALEGVTPLRRELDEAMAQPEGEDKSQRVNAARRKLAAGERYFQWSVQSQNASRLRAMLEVARSFAEIAVTHDRLDADPWLLNVQNGTIDLRTGELREHRREDLCTKLAPVFYDATATAPTWEAFLARAMGDSAELVEYLGRMIGYALTGAVLEHVVGFMFGGGANGKSTCLLTIHAMLGDYATPAPRGLLFRSRGDRHPTELASLHGRRFVTCSEIEEGQAFDEALVKDLSGGDPIECRRMREDFWSFKPTHKLFLAGNHKPTVRGDDEGIWRRIRLVPWTVTIPEAERDPRLPEKLRGELPGILAWAVRGCLAWQAKGLDAPDAVRDATAAYRRENDALGEFFRLNVAFDPEGRVSRKVLRKSYQTYCEDNGAEPFGAKRFAARLRERGVTETSLREGMTVVDAWRGVRMATDGERAAATAWTPGRRDEGTCSEENHPRTSRAHAYVRTNPESVPATPYLPTERQEDFADYVEREGIVGGVT